MECFRNVVNVVGVESRNRDSSVTRHVDVVVTLQLFDLVGAESGVGEHANLTGDVAPIVSAAVLGQLLHQTRAHINDSSRHV